MTIRVAISGANGKMGRLAAELIEADPDFEVAALLGSSTPLAEMEGADLLFDFTVPGSSQTIVEYAVSHGIRALVGTSGWSADRIAHLERVVADNAPAGVVVIPNFSLGSVLATAFAAKAARYFDSAEIVEAHASTKIDSPSGTATRTAELMGRSRDELGPVIAPHSDQRARGQQVSSIPIHSLRLQGIVARQDVIFGGDGETVTITHETTSAQSYARGIMLGLRAAAVAEGVTVGLDTLLDLGL